MGYGLGRRRTREHDESVFLRTVHHPQPRNDLRWLFSSFLRQTHRRKRRVGWAISRALYFSPSRERGRHNSLALVVALRGVRPTPPPASSSSSSSALRGSRVRTGLGRELFVSRMSFLTRISAVSSPIWTINSSNDSHGPWLSRTLSIVLARHRLNHSRTPTEL